MLTFYTRMFHSLNLIDDSFPLGKPIAFKTNTKHFHLRQTINFLGKHNFFSIKSYFYLARNLSDIKSFIARKLVNIL